MNKSTRKKIGIYGGSFNPILISHMMVAKEVYESGKIDELWVVPCGLRPDKFFEIDSPTRLKLMQISLVSWMPRDYNIKIDDIELKENKQIPTYYLMTGFRKFC